MLSLFLLVLVELPRSRCSFATSADCTETAAILSPDVLSGEFGNDRELMVCRPLRGNRLYGRTTRRPRANVEAIVILRQEVRPMNAVSVMGALPQAGIARLR